MLSRLKPLPTDQGFPAGSKFFVTQEVIDRSDDAVKVDEYFDTGCNCSQQVYECNRVMLI